VFFPFPVILLQPSPASFPDKSGVSTLTSSHHTLCRWTACPAPSGACHPSTSFLFHAVPELLLYAPLCRFYVSAEKSVFLLSMVSCLTQVFLTKSDFGSTLLHVIKVCTDIIKQLNKINPLKPELNSSAQRCLTRFLLRALLLEPCISLIYAQKTNKRNNYLFSLFIMYGSSYIFSALHCHLQGAYLVPSE
jgi:hypothetical protein